MLQPGGTIGVAIFFMISGYFLVGKESAHISKVILEGLFYGIFCGNIALILKLTHTVEYISLIQAAQGILVSVTNGYIWWFVSAYVLLMLMVPYLNTFLRSSSRLLSIITLATIFIFPYSLDILFGGIFTGLIKGIFYYLLGGYIHLHVDKGEISIHKILHITSFIISWLLYTADFYMINGDVLQSSMLSKIGNTVGESAFTLVCSTSLFMILKDIKFYNKNINAIASTTFGMYLISDYPLLRMVIWENVWNIQDIYTDGRYFIIKGIAIIMATCSACGIIDYIRQKTIEPHMIRTWSRIINKLNCGSL